MPIHIISIFHVRQSLTVAITLPLYTCGGAALPYIIFIQRFTVVVVTMRLVNCAMAFAFIVLFKIYELIHTRLIDVAHCSLFQSRTRTINCPRRTTSYTLVCAATAATVCWARKKIILSYMYRTPPLRIVVGKNIHSSLHFRRIKHILMVATSMYFIRCAAPHPFSYIIICMCFCHGPPASRACVRPASCTYVRKKRVERIK